jgi:hypothetical protein
MDQINYSSFFLPPAPEVDDQKHEEEQCHCLNSYMDIIQFLMDVRDRSQLIHWSTYKFSTHIAVGEFYDGLEDLIDELAEVMMGAEPTLNFISQEPKTFPMPKTPVEFISCVKKCLMTAEKVVEHEPGLKNKFDEVIGLIDRTKYKLERLVS